MHAYYCLTSNDNARGIDHHFLIFTSRIINFSFLLLEFGKQAWVGFQSALDEKQKAQHKHSESFDIDAGSEKPHLVLFMLFEFSYEAKPDSVRSGTFSLSPTSRSPPDSVVT
jgi:hypothetical protein